MSITFMGMVQFSIAMFFLFVIPYGFYRYVQKQWDEAQQPENCIWKESEKDFQKRVKKLRKEFGYVPKYSCFEETSEEYKELVERVEQIDVKAAEYLRTRALQLPDSRHIAGPCGDGGDLSLNLWWSKTEQGLKYWDDIYQQLR